MCGGTSAVQVCYSCPSSCIIHIYLSSPTINTHVQCSTAGTVPNILDHAGICLECVMFYTPNCILHVRRQTIP